MEKRPFSDFDLSPERRQAIDALGFELTSPIQSAAMQPLLEGRDLVGQSPTGSGKTAAFGIPLLERVDPKKRAVQALVLCPTRELAVQVAGQLHQLANTTKGLHVMPIFGGASFQRQVDGLKRGSQVVIGTPGRVLDHIRRNTLDLSGASAAVLDEADEMLDMGFREDIEAILSELPKDRQTVLFSATMPKAIRELAERFTREPEMVKVAGEKLSTPDIEQIYYEARHRSKPEVLARLLDSHPSPLTMVFCNTKRTVDDVTEDLVARGFAADRLHGDVTQNVRTRVMNAFREQSFGVLVATDVAARGIDVDEVGLVINYDLPFDAEDYVHRIGRTGRAGRSGKAISIVAGRDVYKLQTIQRHTKQKVARFRVPTLDEMEEHRTDRFYNQLREVLVDGSFPKGKRLIDRLLDQGFALTDVTAAALHLLLQSDTKKADAIPEDRPKGAKREMPEKRERKDPASGGGDGDRVDLFVNIGSKMNVSAGDLAGVLYRAGELPNGAVGRIQLFPKHALMDVPADAVEDLLRNLRDVKVRGKDVRFRVAEERPQFERRSSFRERDDRGGPPRRPRGDDRRGGGGGSRREGDEREERRPRRKPWEGMKGKPRRKDRRRG